MHGCSETGISLRARSLMNGTRESTSSISLLSQRIGRDSHPWTGEARGRSRLDGGRSYLIDLSYWQITCQAHSIQDMPTKIICLAVRWCDIVNGMGAKSTKTASRFTTTLG